LPTLDGDKNEDNLDPELRRNRPLKDRGTAVDAKLQELIIKNNLGDR
jgi:hypothetical protein